MRDVSAIWEQLPRGCRACRWEKGGPNCACARDLAPTNDRATNALCIIAPVGMMLLFVLGLVVFSL